MNPIEYIHDLQWSDIPEPVRHQAARCLLDTVGVFYGGTHTDLSKIIYDFTAMSYGGNQAKLWLDGRPVSLAGAALAHGMTIDALELVTKYRALANDRISSQQASEMEKTCLGMSELASAKVIQDLLYQTDAS